MRLLMLRISVICQMMQMRNKMAINEDTLRKLGKEEIIKLALEYQPKFDSTLSSTRVIKTDVWTEEVLRKTRVCSGSNKRKEH